MALGHTRRLVIVLAAAAALGLTACSGSTTGPSGGGDPAARRPRRARSTCSTSCRRATHRARPSVDVRRAEHDRPDGADRGLARHLLQARAARSAPRERSSRPSSPKSGVTIKRDKYGMPYVYGTTDDDTAWGAGYAGTEDRMFVMDALRYAGSGRYSELLGREQGQSGAGRRSAPAGRLHAR